MSQKSSKIPNVDAGAYIKMRIIHGFHQFCRVCTPHVCNPCIIRQYIHGKTDENHVLFSNSTPEVPVFLRKFPDFRKFCTGGSVV